MIWFTIALFVVSFLVTALLAPKPDIEDARAGSLDDVQFPQATEDAPVPLVLGKVRLNAPNTIWYGDFSTVPMTERIRISIFKKATIVVGHKYYLGLDMGLALGDDVQMTELFIDEESVWAGTTSATLPTTGSINKPTLFGGYKEGGGWVGGFTFYPGSFSQPVNSYLEGLIGVGDVPAYRGMSRIVFEGPNIGESNQLRKMAFILQKYTDAIGTPNGGKIGVDMNPVEALYQILTDEWIGLGIDTTLVDIASFLAAGTTLDTEGNGVSVVVTSAAQGKTVIKEILRQIDAIMFQDPETGKFKLKLIRDDYVVSDLQEFDEDDIIQVRNFTKTSWEDVVAQVKVSFPQLEKESSVVAISQDMATAAMIGRLKTVTMSFPFCYNKTTANAIASRERAQQSVPLFRMTLEMNRNAYTLRPGDVFKISWPEYGLSNLVMRVQKHDLGELLNNKIVVDCLQDSFAVSTVVFANPGASGWVAPVTQPTSILSYVAEDLPAFFSRKITDVVADGYSQPLIIPLKPSTASTGYSMFGGITSGDLVTVEPDTVAYPATGTITAAYDKATGQTTGIDAAGFAITSELGTFAPAVDEAELLRGEAGLVYVGGEIMGFLGRTGDTLQTVYRGLFGTSVKSHLSGARVYQITPDNMGIGVAAGELHNLETWYFKLTDRVGSLQQDISEVTEYSFNPPNTMVLQQRPRNVLLNATRVFTTLGTLADLDISLRATTRLTDDSYPKETDAAETPAEAEVYQIKVYLGGVEDVSLGATDQTMPYTIPFSGLSAPQEHTDCEIRVWGKQTGTDSFNSAHYGSLSFAMDVTSSKLLTEGDMQSGTDVILLEGDMQSGTDKLSLEGDEA